LGIGRDASSTSEKKMLVLSQKRWIGEREGWCGDAPDIMRDWKRWTLAAGKATAAFNSYGVGAYAEGPYECVFDMDKYKALAKPDALLP
jgi:hypothetical protein